VIYAVCIHYADQGGGKDGTSFLMLVRGAPTSHRSKKYVRLCEMAPSTKTHEQIPSDYRVVREYHWGEGWFRLYAGASLLNVSATPRILITLRKL